MSSATPPVVPELTSSTSQIVRKRQREKRWFFACGGAALIVLSTGIGLLFLKWNRKLAHWVEASRLETLGCQVDWQPSKKEPEGGSTSLVLASIDEKKFPLQDSDLKGLDLLTRVRNIEFSRCENITDDGLKWLEPLAELEDLTLGTFEKPMPHISDASMAHVARLKSLKILCIAGSKVTDDGIAQLTSLEKLEHIDLTGTKITDKSLSYLARLPNLKGVLLEQTGVTERAIRAMQRARPAIEIHSDYDQDVFAPPGAATP